MSDKKTLNLLHLKLESAFHALNNQTMQIYICVRAKNVCGYSPVVCQNLIIPKRNTNCPECLLGLLPPREILIEYVSNSSAFQIKVKQTPLASSYEWSFDNILWNEIANQENEEFNYFGQIEATPDSFIMYVRAKNLDTLSSTYFQKIALLTANQRSIINGSSNMDYFVTHNEFSDTQIRGTKGVEPKTFSYILYNYLGQAIKQGTCDDENSNQPISSENFRPGFYIVVIMNPDNSIRKVWKNILVK